MYMINGKKCSQDEFILGINNFLERLGKENKIMQEALEFYADFNNWKIKYDVDCDCIDDSDLDSRTPDSYGGKRAREVLNSIGGST